MDTIKKANKIIQEGIALLPDDAKQDFKAQAGDIFINEAIGNACAMVQEDAEKQALLTAYAIQEANRVVTTLWRLELLPGKVEEEYRELPSLKEVADEYNVWTAKRKARMDAIMDQHRAISGEEKELDLFKGVINGLTKKQSEAQYRKFEAQQQAAMNGGR